MIANYTETETQRGEGCNNEVSKGEKKQPKPLAKSSKTEHSFLLLRSIKWRL